MGDNVATQKVDTSETFPALSRVASNAPLERLANFSLPRLAHGVVLISLDLRAEMVVQANKNVLNGDHAPRRLLGVRPNGAVPGEASNANWKGPQRWAGRGLHESGWGQLEVGVVGVVTHVVLQTWRGQHGVEVYTGGKRRGGDIWESMGLGNW